MGIRFFIVFLILFLVNVRQISAQEIYLGNKLRSIPEQLNDLRKECKYLEDQEACSREMRRLQVSKSQLNKLCRKNPQDPLCTNIAEIKKEKLDDLKILCMKRPFERKCQEKKEQLKKRQKKCEKNPRAANCQPSTRKSPKNQAELLEHCKINPRSKYCAKLNQIDSDKNRKEESQKGLSTF